MVAVVRKFHAPSVSGGENGDGSQRICDICYESNATNENFPEDVDPVSIEEEDVFSSDDDKGEEEKAIPWLDVKQNTWMKVDDMTTLDTINGKAMIVYPKKRDGIVIKAWTTKLIGKYLTVKMASNDGSKNLYIMSLGEKTAEKSK